MGPIEVSYMLLAGAILAGAVALYSPQSCPAQVSYRFIGKITVVAEYPCGLGLLHGLIAHANLDHVLTQQPDDRGHGEGGHDDTNLQDEHSPIPIHTLGALLL